MVDFSLKAQYRRHRPDTLVYIKWYLQTFEWSKDIFLECCTTKAMHAESDREDRDIRDLMAKQHANEARYKTAAKRLRPVNQDRLKRSNQRGDLIRCENHFNCIKIHYLGYFLSSVRHFGSISMYAAEIGELLDKE